MQESPIFFPELLEIINVFLRILKYIIDEKTTTHTPSLVPLQLSKSIGEAYVYNGNQNGTNIEFFRIIQFGIDPCEKV